MIDLVITGGKLVTPEFLLQADLAVKEGRIWGIGSEGAFPNASKFVRADGKLVMPGGVDPHVHMKPKSFGKTSREDYRSSSLAAAFGGTTTVIDFARQQVGSPLLTQSKICKMRLKAMLSSITHSIAYWSILRLVLALESLR